MLFFIVDLEKCIVFLYGEDFLQIGNCCIVVKIKVNRVVIEWLEQNKVYELVGNI